MRLFTLQRHSKAFPSTTFFDFHKHIHVRTHMPRLLPTAFPLLLHHFIFFPSTEWEEREVLTISHLSHISSPLGHSPPLSWWLKCGRIPHQDKMDTRDPHGYINASLLPSLLQFSVSLLKVYSLLPVSPFSLSHSPSPLFPSPPIY